MPLRALRLGAIAILSIVAGNSDVLTTRDADDVLTMGAHTRTVATHMVAFL